MSVAVRVREVGQTHTERALSRDMSVSGMFVLTKQPYEVGCKVELVFDLPGIETDVQVEGLVRRVVTPAASGAAPGLGIEFTIVKPRAAKAIHFFVAQHLRNT